MKENELKSFIYGGISGAIARSATAPIERIKVLRQIRNTYARESLINNFQRIYHKEGVKGYFNGNGANLYRIVPQQAVLFGCYRYFDSRFDSPLLSGSMAGLISITAVYPMKVIRTKLTVQTNKGDFRNMTHILRETHIKELYKGIRMAWTGTIPFHGINYYTYQRTRPYVGDFWAGCTSASVAIMFTYPTDLITRKLQLSGTKYNKETYSSLLDAVKKTFKNGGIRGMYRGMLAAQIRLIPSNGIAFMLYEKLKETFG